MEAVKVFKNKNKNVTFDALINVGLGNMNCNSSLIIQSISLNTNWCLHISSTWSPLVDVVMLHIYCINSFHWQKSRWYFSVALPLFLVSPVSWSQYVSFQPVLLMCFLSWKRKELFFAHFSWHLTGNSFPSFTCLVLSKWNLPQQKYEWGEMKKRSWNTRDSFLLSSFQYCMFIVCYFGLSISIDDIAIQKFDVSEKRIENRNKWKLKCACRDCCDNG